MVILFVGLVVLIWSEAFYLFTGIAGAQILALVSAPVVIVQCVRLWIAQDKAKTAAALFIDSQAKTLARRRSQLILVDDYGVPHTEAWQKEQDAFLRSALRLHLRSAGFSSFIAEGLSMRKLRKQTEAAAVRGRAASTIEAVKTGIDFEHHCAALLNDGGWSSRVTKATGDQGVDIIAEKLGRRVVVQCKFYSKPVGNKAVQEAAAARLHERADLACVVSNATYTKACRQLAATTGVLLSHYDEVASALDERFDFA